MNLFFVHIVGRKLKGNRMKPKYLVFFDFEYTNVVEEISPDLENGFDREVVSIYKFEGNEYFQYLGNGKWETINGEKSTRKEN